MSREDPENRGFADPHELIIARDARDRLVATDGEGNQFVDVTPLRLFPHTDPSNWISLLDSSGREVTCIADPSRLTSGSAQVLAEALSAREFVPLLKRIISVSGNSCPCEWRVETDRGETSFIVNDDKDVRRLNTFGAIVVDAHGIRYILEDYRKLDAYGRRVIEWYI